MKIFKFHQADNIMDEMDEFLCETRINDKSVSGSRAWIVFPFPWERERERREVGKIVHTYLDESGETYTRTKKETHKNGVKGIGW